MPYVLEDSDEADEHVERIEDFYGRHSLTGCPPSTRAMCSYARYRPSDEDIANERAVRDAFDELERMQPRIGEYIPPPD